MNALPRMKARESAELSLYSSSQESAEILRIEELTASVDGFRILDGLSLSLSIGELRCVIGPNGAGKTTFLDVITGKIRPDHGRVTFRSDLDLLKLREHEIARAGVGRKFQKPTVFERHTVFENLELALRCDKRVWASFVARLQPQQQQRIEEILETINLTHVRSRPAGSLSHGQKQWLEIGMLLAQEPRLLLLDEPVAGMSDLEVEYTAQLLRDLAGKHSIIVVEHDMAFIRSIADTVTVMHQGKVFTEGKMDTIQSDPGVIEIYLGGTEE